MTGACSAVSTASVTVINVITVTAATVTAATIITAIVVAAIVVAAFAGAAAVITAFAGPAAITTTGFLVGGRAHLASASGDQIIRKPDGKNRSDDNEQCLETLGRVAYLLRALVSHDSDENRPIRE